MMTEKEIQNLAFVIAGEEGAFLFRNNVGVAYTSSGSIVRYGLLNGSSDLIGIKAIEITSDMIGQKIGVFVSIECKKEDWKPPKTPSKSDGAQQKWMNFISSNGGIAGFAKSEDDIRRILKSIGDYKSNVIN